MFLVLNHEARETVFDLGLIWVVYNARALFSLIFDTGIGYLG